MVAEADTTGDKKLTYDEFRTVLLAEPHASDDAPADADADDDGAVVEASDDGSEAETSSE
jgi:hypothetical protein